MTKKNNLIARIEGDRASHRVPRRGLLGVATAPIGVAATHKVFLFYFILFYLEICIATKLNNWNKYFILTFFIPNNT
jgi:hypothetical protein